MALSSLLQRSTVVLTGLILLLAALAVGIYLFYRRRAKSGGEENTQGLFQMPEYGSVGALGVLRTALVFLAFVVAAGFVLILLPQGTIETMTHGLQSRYAPPPAQEMISFLYLGDEVKDNEFHIRGVIRNITTQPVEHLDAALRLYSQDGSLLETAVVRMDTELIQPDATAEFHLNYPNYKGQFGSYSVDFKLRQGELVPYKDVRGTRVRS